MLDKRNILLLHTVVHSKD